VVGDGGEGVGGLSARPAAVRPWDEAESTGLSSLHIGPLDGRWDHHPFVGGEGWGWNDHPGNRECMPVDPFADAHEELSRSSWRAVSASILTKLDRDREVHTVQLAENGNFLRYRAGVGVAPACAGNRGVILGFSGASRLRMLRFFNSVDRLAVVPLCLWFLTLTYPAQWPSDARAWKAQLKAFKKRLERAWGHMGVVWKLEPQDRGAPHFHLILNVAPEMSAGLVRLGERFRNGRRQTIWTGGKLSEFRQWVSRAWFEVVGSGDERHLHAGTSVEPLESWNGVVSYASKYIGKEAVFADQATGEALRVGRIWGVWRRELWPVRLVSRTLGRAEWVRARRILRRYLESTGRRRLRGEDGRPPAFQWIGEPRSCSAFIPFEIASRVFRHVCWFGEDYGSLWAIRRRLSRHIELSRERKYFI
jgi:hypothetical protein